VRAKDHQREKGCSARTLKARYVSGYLRSESLIGCGDHVINVSVHVTAA